MTPDTRDVGGMAETGSGEYAALHVEDESLVVYDRENHRAWIQSDLAVALDWMP